MRRIFIQFKTGRVKLIGRVRLNKVLAKTFFNIIQQVRVHFLSSNKKPCSSDFDK